MAWLFEKEAIFIGIKKLSLAVPMDKLVQAYTNEKATTILLKYETIIDEFNAIIKDHVLDDGSNSNLLNTFEEIEMERIKYFIKEYILTRLDKIRGNFFIEKALMSPKERVFAEKYKAMMMKMSIYAEVPSKEIEVVGFIAQRKIKAMKIDEQIVEVFIGDFFVANYNDISSYVEDGSVVLV